MLSEVSPTLALVLCLVLLLPATARVTRLVTRDKIPLIAAPRDAFVRRWGVWEMSSDERAKLSKTERWTAIGGKRTNWLAASLAYLWECDWCASVWVGGGLTALTWYYPQVALWVLAGLTASYAAGWSAIAESCADRGRE